MNDMIVSVLCSLMWFKYIKRNSIGSYMIEFVGGGGGDQFTQKILIWVWPKLPPRPTVSDGCYHCTVVYINSVYWTLINGRWNETVKQRQTTQAIYKAHHTHSKMQYLNFLLNCMVYVLGHAKKNYVMELHLWLSRKWKSFDMCHQSLSCLLLLPLLTQSSRVCNITWVTFCVWSYYLISPCW